MSEEKKDNMNESIDKESEKNFIDNKEEDKELNFSKKKMIYGSNEYGEASSELCRSNENEYGRTDYDERARKELIRNSRSKNVMSSNTGRETRKIEPAESIILKLNAEDIRDQYQKKRGESEESSEKEQERGESGEEDKDLNERGNSG
jgi:hypothetical protein